MRDIGDHLWPLRYSMGARKFRDGLLRPARSMNQVSLDHFLAQMRHASKSMARVNLHTFTSMVIGEGPSTIIEVHIDGDPTPVDQVEALNRCCRSRICFC